MTLNISRFTTPHHREGFELFLDTIVAMEALVRYSYNSRIKDITDLNVEVDIPDSNITMNYYIDGKVSESSLWSFLICVIIVTGLKEER